MRDCGALGMTSCTSRHLAHLELIASAAARQPMAFVRSLLDYDTLEAAIALPPGGCYILGVRQAESSEVWQRDNPLPG